MAANHPENKILFTPTFFKLKGVTSHLSTLIWSQLCDYRPCKLSRPRDVINNIQSITHGSSCCPGKLLARRTAVVAWLPLVRALLLFFTPIQMDKTNKIPPTATSTMATVEDLMPSVCSSSLPSGSVEFPAGVAVEPLVASPSKGMTVHTIMTTPRAMSPTPRAHRA